MADYSNIIRIKLIPEIKEASCEGCFFSEKDNCPENCSFGWVWAKVEPEEEDKEKNCG